MAIDLRDRITPKHLVMGRRRFLHGGAAAGLAAAGLPIAAGRAAAQQGDLVITDKDDATSYTNYYEFGTGKSDASRLAPDLLTLSPWSVTFDGMFDNPGTYDLRDLLAGIPVEDRVYRFRCVEAWSMVIPWQGVPLAALLEKARPHSGATHVAFTTLYRPEEMPGQNGGVGLDWPYREGLRMDEALHPLALMATGMYGEPLPAQNGAPLRLVLPWKYGFKSIKAIVRITATDREPPTTWQQMAPQEYGFYANVNPTVDHPRWSQATERPVGGGLFAGRQDTLMFNGYEDEVAGLYAGMDLRRFY